MGRFLDIIEAAELVNREVHPCSTRQMRNWADKGLLPFIISFDGRRRIEENELKMWFQRLQIDATNKLKDDTKKRLKKNPFKRPS